MELWHTISSLCMSISTHNFDFLNSFYKFETNVGSGDNTFVNMATI
jgi:hypothetical protein